MLWRISRRSAGGRVLPSPLCVALLWSGRSWVCRHLGERISLPGLCLLSLPVITGSSSFYSVNERVESGCCQKVPLYSIAEPCMAKRHLAHGGINQRQVFPPLLKLYIWVIRAHLGPQELTVKTHRELLQQEFSSCQTRVVLCNWLPRLLTEHMHVWMAALSCSPRSRCLPKPLYKLNKQCGVLIAWKGCKAWPKMILEILVCFVGFFFSETEVCFTVKLYLMSNRKDGGNLPWRAKGQNDFPRVPQVLQSRSWFEPTAPEY